MSWKTGAICRTQMTRAGLLLRVSGFEVMSYLLPVEAHHALAHGIHKSLNLLKHTKCRRWQP